MFPDQYGRIQKLMAMTNKSTLRTYVQLEDTWSGVWLRHLPTHCILQLAIGCLSPEDK